MNIDDVLRSHGILGGRSKDNIPPPPITNFTVDRVGDGFLDLSWSNPDDTDFVGVRIQRKTGGYPISENDGDTAYDGTGTSFTDSGLTNGTTYYYRAFPYDFDSNFQTDTGQQVSGTPTANDDTTNAPGPKNLIDGTMDAGFFGEVPANELFTASEIASACGITEGTAQHENEPWLKFAIDGKIIFRPRKAIRHSISWNAINNANCVYGGSGGKTVSKNGLTYRVRLMKGALTDPSKSGDSDRGAKGSEWNRLMLPIHEKAIDKSWTYPEYVEDNVPVWNHNFGSGRDGMYTDADLMTHRNHGDGSYVWCQETPESSASHRVYRGDAGVSRSHWSASSDTSADLGWSPVLELL